MYSDLISIGPFVIRSYGLMLAVSIYVSLYYIHKMAHLSGVEFDRLLTVAFILFLGGVIGARIFYVMYHIGEFSNDWLSVFNPIGSGGYGMSGFTVYGGIVVAVACASVYLKLNEVSVLKVFDTVAPSLGIGTFFTRIGCYLNGCCYGTPTDLPWGTIFPAGSIPHQAFGGIPLHPAQLYSSLGGLFLFLFLHWRLLNRKFVGQVIAMCFMLEAGLRFAIEQIRHYETAFYQSVFGFDLNYNEILAAGFFSFGLGIYMYQSCRQRKVYSTGSTDTGMEQKPSQSNPHLE